jgi:hypothetical protein
MDLTISRRTIDGDWSEPLPEWDSPSTLVQVYGPASLIEDPSPLEEIGLLYPNSIIVGCSGAGIVIDDQISDSQIVVSVTRFENVRLSVVFDNVSRSTDQTEIGKDIANKLLKQDKAVSGVLLFATGEGMDGDALGQGIDLIDNATISQVGGGVAGSLPDENGVFGTTWVLDANHTPAEGVISAVGFSGDRLIFENAAKGGWKPLGPERVVTRADEHTVYEIDGQPALDLYKQYLGDKAVELPAIASIFPLTTRPQTGGEKDWAPAGVLSVDENTKSLLLTRKISDGAPTQMLRGYAGDLFEAAEDAAIELKPSDDIKQLVIVTSCLGRRVKLGSRTADELSSVRQALPDGIGMVGFYGMGEFSTTPSTTCQLYNYTMTLALIAER